MTPNKLVLTREQGDALYEGLGNLMASLRFEIRTRAGEISDADRNAADREYQRWESLWEELAEHGCRSPAHFNAAERPPTVEIREDRDWLAESSLRALTGTARVLQLTIESRLGDASPLAQIKTEIEVLRELDSLLDEIGWPQEIPLPPPPFPWTVYAQPAEE